MSYCSGDEKELLPHDLIIDILSWLPPEKLLKFSCVCKAWYFTIRDVKFIVEHHKSHYASNPKNNNRIMIATWEDSTKFSLVVHDTYPAKVLYDIIDLSKFRTITKSISDNVEIGQFCLDSDDRDLYLIEGSCNGLICWANFNVDRSPILLCNPSIRLTTLVPTFRLSQENMPIHQSVHYNYGVGFDRVSFDYKVIKFLVPKKDYLMYGTSDFKLKPNSRGRAAIYSVKAKSWTEIVNANIPPNYVPYGSSSFFLHGFIHWLAAERKEKTRELKIILFDVCNNVFCHELLQIPPAIGTDITMGEISIHMVNNSICLLDNPNYFKVFGTNHQLCYVWMMKEYGSSESWVKQFTIAPKNGIGRCIRPTIGGKFLYARSPFRQFTIHDPETNDEDKKIGHSTHEYVMHNICSVAPTLELLGIN